MLVHKTTSALQPFWYTFLRIVTLLLLFYRPSPVHHILTIGLSEKLGNEESFGGKSSSAVTKRND